MAAARFTSKHPYDARHPHALAIYCSDGRFTDAVEELLHSLGHPRLDTLTVPGGAAHFNPRSAGFADWDALSRGSSFLIRGHSIQHVVLLAHEGCGHYRARNVGETDAQIAREQISDLHIAAQVLRSTHPGLQVVLYMAKVHQKHVVFDPIEEEALAYLSPAPGS